MTTPSQDHPPLSDVFDETVSAIGAPALYGPPVIFLLGPWLLFVLLLIPPAAFLLTLGLVVIVVALPVALLVASPYLLVRHVRARHEAHRRRLASVPAPARRRAPAGSAASGPRGWQPSAHTAFRSSTDSRR
jgi:hypothetical protein